jgi:glycosyltransferase involved in cell wall biosynthesis
MRIAYTLRELSEAATCESSTYTCAMANLMAEAGHRVSLVTETAPEMARPRLHDRVRVVPTAPADPDVWHLAPFHAYADRVHRTLSRLAEQGLDLAEAPAAGGEAFTVVRSRRLLGAPSPPCVVRLAGGDPPVATPPVQFGQQMLAWTHQYLLDNAEALALPAPARSTTRAGPTGARLSASWAVPWPTDTPPPPAPVISEPVRRIVFVGEYSDGGGLGRFLAAAGLLARRDASYSFEAYGHDTATGWFGRSYLDRARQLADRVRPGLVAFRPAPRLGDLGALFGVPAIYVLTASAARHLLFTVMLHGTPVMTDAGLSPAGGPLEGRAILVDAQSPETLADAVSAVADRPSRLRRIAAAAREYAWSQVNRPTVRARAERLYEAAMRPTARGRARRIRPLVSVVVPLFNQGRFVLEAVSSARASTGARIEIVVVDDGSTDPYTRRVFDGLDGVVKIRQENRGLAGARNTGVAATNGRYILPLDADDLVAPDYVEKATRALESNPDLAYVSSYTRNFGLFGGVYAAFGTVPSLMPFLHTAGRCTTLFHRRAVEAVGGYDEDLPAYEDWDLLIRLAKAGLDGDVIPEPLFHYRRHLQSMVFRFSNRYRVELIQELIRRHADLLEGQGLDTVLTLLHLWKTGFEVSESTRFSRSRWRC